jgi:NADPH:quinone reductase-like Zn-dependent oxidoreductase
MGHGLMETSLTMKAIVQTGYGGPEQLSLQEIETPTPQEGEVLVRVRAAALNAGDLYKLKGTPFAVRTQMGLFKPQETRYGSDFAGVVAAVGPGVSNFAVGDEVFSLRTGACAEYVCKQVKTLARKPVNLSFEEAAAMPVAAATALQGLRNHGHLQAGQRVLVNGAGGGVGTFAVQVARAMGGEVTAVCGPRNVELVKSLGAARVVDYTQSDFTQTAERYDVIFDNAGTRSLGATQRLLTPNGRLVVVGAVPKGGLLGPAGRLLAAVVKARLGDQRIAAFITSVTEADMLTLKDMAETGQVKPVIDRCYPLSAVPDAAAYLAQGHARGKVVITVSAN